MKGGYITAICFYGHTCFIDRFAFCSIQSIMILSKMLALLRPLYFKKLRRIAYLLIFSNQSKIVLFLREVTEFTLILLKIAKHFLVLKARVYPSFLSNNRYVLLAREGSLGKGFGSRFLPRNGCCGSNKPS